MDVTNVKVEFTIYSDKLKHEEISKKMGILPSHIRHSTEVLKNGKLFGQDEWGIETEYEASLDINNQLTKITNILMDKSKVIKEVCKKFNAKCSFVIVINVENGEFPAMGFETEFLKFAATINANIAFDPYFMSDCE